MKYREFCRRARSSVIALGSSEFGGTCPQEKAFDLLDAYAAIGGNFIDTARVYGDFRHAEERREREGHRPLDGAAPQPRAASS